MSAGSAGLDEPHAPLFNRVINLQKCRGLFMPVELQCMNANQSVQPN